MIRKERLDKLLVERDLAPTRARAQALFTSEETAVFVGDRRADRPGALVDASLPIRVEGTPLRFVSRGGLKLEGALEHFGLDATGLSALDIGASTGGFTDCLLQRGAAQVIALDVGIDQLAPKLRADPRVIVREKVNARALTEADVPFHVQLVVVDVSFISLRLVLPSALPFLDPGGAIVALVKPQFEVGRDGLGKKGVVRDETRRRAAIESIRDFARDELGLEVIGWIDAPIAGPEGNREALLYARLPAGPSSSNPPCNASCWQCRDRSR
ncbi:MAG: TlyA family RNA methyltransferase [Myxococcales bacterium]|jgi:23S rRNA (cytidine1920-2'-O)/16S rRNA (cytidine1409-2'-O)-methyltransferase|nr:TlyA family RNA methyltransferase [Myxococcales bacterium]